MRHTITTLLFSSLLFTAAAYASPPPGDSPAPTLHISTGITPPKLLDSVALSVPDQIVESNIPAGTQIAVSYVVDAKGQPRDIRIVHGYDLIVNARALDAVSKLHYRPASLDNQPIPMGMNLVITLGQ